MPFIYIGPESKSFLESCLPFVFACISVVTHDRYRSSRYKSCQIHVGHLRIFVEAFGLPGNPAARLTIKEDTSKIQKASQRSHTNHTKYMTWKNSSNRQGKSSSEAF